MEKRGRIEYFQAKDLAVFQSMTTIAFVPSGVSQPMLSRPGSRRMSVRYTYAASASRL